jgi:hypothetical protein
VTIRLVKFNEVPTWWCFTCGDSGLIEHFRADETLLRYEKCDCKQPLIWKPFTREVWKLSDVERIAERRKKIYCPF